MNKKYLLLTIIWVLIIFSFSLQSGDESGNLSGGIVVWLANFLRIEKIMSLEAFHFIVRKAAHFTEFFILGVLASNSINCSGIRKEMLFRFVFCMVIAATDETIQLFMDGRAGQIADVILDSCGALTGIGIIQLICKRKKNI